MAGWGVVTQAIDGHFHPSGIQLAALRGCLPRRMGLVLLMWISTLRVPAGRRAKEVSSRTTRGQTAAGGPCQKRVLRTAQRGSFLPPSRKLPSTSTRVGRHGSQ